MASVKCNVGSCKYQRESTCQSPAVNVESRSGIEAQNCAGTQCQTFEQREKEPREERANK